MKATRNLAISALLAAACFAGAQVVPEGTEVMLRFMDPVSSRTAKAGDTIHFKIAHSVTSADGKVIMAEGTPVNGVIEAVNKSDHFGKNARIRIAINPINGLALEPRDKGKPFQGASTDHAAIASGAGAVLLGPLGLAGGYFITGKSVNIKAGDTLRTEVSKPERPK